MVFTSNEAGAEIAGSRRYFDAWGKANTSTADYRGYTGHEQFDEFNLVHMNGRVYDPTIGRFLSPDPNIDGPLDTQGWNRYSYVKNNPLSYTDPTGYFSLKKFFKKWIGAAISVGFAMAGMPFIGGLISSAVSTALNGGKLGDFAKGFVIGSVAGFVAGPVAGRLSSYVGMAGGSVATQVFRGAAAGGIAGGISSSLSGCVFRRCRAGIPREAGPLFRSKPG